MDLSTDDAWSCFTTALKKPFDKMSWFKFGGSKTDIDPEKLENPEVAAAESEESMASVTSIDSFASKSEVLPRKEEEELDQNSDSDVEDVEVLPYTSVFDWVSGSCICNV